MRDYDMATPEVVLKDGEYRMQLDLLVGTDDDVAAAFEAAVAVIRRIQGRADDEKRGGVSDAFHYYDALYDMAEWWSRPFPKAATAAFNLAEWCKSKDQHDFTPPADDLPDRAEIAADLSFIGERLRDIGDGAAADEVESIASELVRGNDG